MNLSLIVILVVAAVLGLSWALAEWLIRRSATGWERDGGEPG